MKALSLYTKKNVLVSKTYWLNIIMAILQGFSDNPESWIRENQGWFAFIWMVLAMIVRYFTKDKVVLIK